MLASPSYFHHCLQINQSDKATVGMVLLALRLFLLIKHGSQGNLVCLFCLCLTGLYKLRLLVTSLTIVS